MDLIFKALADPARRAILDALRQSDGQTLSELDARFDMTRFGVMKHLAVLEEATLITTVKRGRYKYHYLNAVPLQETLDQWMEPHRVKPAAQSMLDLKARLEGAAPDFVEAAFVMSGSDRIWAMLTEASGLRQCLAFGTDVREQADSFQIAGTDGTPIATLRGPEFASEGRWDGQLLWHGGASSRLLITVRPDIGFCEVSVALFTLPPDTGWLREAWGRTLAGLKTTLETGTPTKFQHPRFAATDQPTPKETPK